MSLTPVRFRAAAFKRHIWIKLLLNDALELLLEIRLTSALGLNFGAFPVSKAKLFLHSVSTCFFKVQFWKFGKASICSNKRDS